VCCVLIYLYISNLYVLIGRVSFSLSLTFRSRLNGSVVYIYLKWTDDGTRRFAYTQLSRAHKQIKSLTDASRQNSNINFLPCVYLSEMKKSFKLDLTFLLKDSSGCCLFSRACHLMINLPLTFFLVFSSEIESRGG
jgi:hypothetical protein